MAYGDFEQDSPWFEEQNMAPVPSGANTGSGPWAPGYDPGPNWNGGQAPIPNGRYDYNGGSPVNDPSEPLKAGNGWEWQGPQTPQWDMTAKQWNQGAWNQTPGRGLGYTPAPDVVTPPPATSGPAPAPTGSVPSLPGGEAPVSNTMPTGASAPSPIAGPPATLPLDITGLFGQQPTKTPTQSAYQDALLRYMGKAQDTPSLDDAVLGPQTEVFRASQQRGQERSRRVNAERAAATGQGQSGYLDNLINQGVQQQNFNTASFDANLLGGEMNKRREELQAGLQLAGATGNQEATRELQNKLEQARAMMQQQGLNLQGQLGGRDLDLRQWMAMMGNDQFYDQLGVNSAFNMENLNQRALQMIMGGG